MLIYLTKYFLEHYFACNLFLSVPFRAFSSLITALLTSFLIGPHIITYFQQLSFSQIIRKSSPKSHFKKKNIPIMGGIIILISTVVSVLLWSYLSNSYIWYVLIVLIGYGIIGFIDDYRKIVYNSSVGLIASLKYFWMSIIAIGVISIFHFTNENIPTIKLIIPLFENINLQLGIFYILLDYFVIVGTGNAVNLTDGLDGLAIVPIIFVAIGFSIIALATSNVELACYLRIPYTKSAEELVIICMAIIGSSLGFLWYNTYPAQILMGDIGALALGGTLGTIAVLIHQEFLLAIMGGLFVIEALSVIVQIFFFKLYGRRIFRMAPIHHHYELKGWPEPRIVVRFWIIALIFMLIGLIILQVR